jgi:hypothetical protein
MIHEYYYCSNNLHTASIYILEDDSLLNVFISISTLTTTMTVKMLLSQGKRIVCGIITGLGRARS